MAGQILFIALLAGIVQGITGFGAGIVMMMLPLQFAVAQSAGISSSICLVLSGVMAYQYRKHINLKKIVAPAVLYIACSSASIMFAARVDQDVMRMILGAFLTILAIYFLFFSKNNFAPTGIVSVLCIVISGICDGMFGVGGPLMVLYYMAKTKDKDEYLGTIQAFFVIVVFYAGIFRAVNGILAPELILPIAIGMAGILAGLKIANKIVDRLNPAMIQKLTYMLIGICGLTNLF
ncbi:sulfite exporter TauE/SafE family protein [Erysipelotrichaceae bacterium 66-17]|uniref:sulfite exporter TauE/SafE family protein n=1 Tax=uncultured Dubosiella sp. TaxID=1937011 RepID=UPI00261E45C4|nr:sulfite exporter TauE/SafE family protein [uncultured Dubosiella sp.]